MRLLILLLLTIASTGFAETTEQTANVKTNGGRFQLIQLSPFRRDQFLIDTNTGTVWNHVCSKENEAGTDCEAFSWQKEEVEGIHSRIKNQK